VPFQRGLLRDRYGSWDDPSDGCAGGSLVPEIAEDVATVLTVPLDVVIDVGDEAIDDAKEYGTDLWDGFAGMGRDIDNALSEAHEQGELTGPIDYLYVHGPEMANAVYEESIGAVVDGANYVWDHTVISVEVCIGACQGLSHQAGHVFYDYGGFGFSASAGVGWSTATVQEKGDAIVGGRTAFVRYGINYWSIEMGEGIDGTTYWEFSLNLGFGERGGPGLSREIYPR
jgi:hypothetical protein